ncbi:MAG: hypothetical protein LBB73_04315, partial [Dysgonamonadaceae bacterium]|nr:hypothetical protein [Dysgonamonadaceae bacterium]
MKRNRNFLLIVWAAALVGLFAGVEAVHAENEGVFVPKEFGLYLIKDGKESPLTVDPSNFVDTVTNYHAYVPVRADSVYLGIKWEKENLLPDGGKADSIPVEVREGESLVKGIPNESGGDGALTSGTYKGHYDTVYLITFETMKDKIEGKLSFEVPGMGKFEYNLTIDRVAANNIADLVKLFVVAKAPSSGVSEETVNKEEWETQIKDGNLYDSGNTEDSIFFKSINSLTGVVDPGDHVETDSVNADQKLALVLRKKDVFSDIEVVQGSDTAITSIGTFVGDCSVYPIEAGKFVTITVTSESGQKTSTY